MPNSKLDITLETFPTFNSGTGKWAFRFHIQNLGPDTIPTSTAIDLTIGDFSYVPFISFTSTKTSSIVAVGSNNNKFRFTTNQAIASGSSVPIDALYTKTETPPWTLKISQLVFNTSGFTAFSFTPFYIFSYTGLGSGQSIITAGLFAGSTSIDVLSNCSPGVSLLVYSGDTQIGTATTDLTGINTITLSSPIQAGLPYIVYQGSKGFGTYGPSLAVESNTGLTGWRVAETVNGTNINLWEGEDVAAIYDPSESINIGYAIKNVATMFDLVPKFNLIITRSGSSVIVTVDNISPWLGNARIQFDGGTINNTRTKTYSAVGSSAIQRVKVLHENNNAVYSEQTFIISNTLVSSTTQIWGASYEPNKVNNQTVILLAYSKVPIEARIVQLAPSSGGGVGAWVSMTPSGGGAQKFTQPIYTNVPSGNYTAEYRVIGDSTILTIPISITWN
jgi:hypothetical protein